MISIVVLAAGAATRLGGGKLALKLKGKSLLRHAVDAASSSKADEVIVVLGHDADRLKRELRPDAGVKILENPDYDLGMSSSLKAGIRSVSPAAHAAMIMLADQPLVDSGILNAVIDKFEETHAPVVAPSYGGRQGNPVLFDRSVFNELMEISGDVGGRQVVARHRDKLALIFVETPDADRDIDTWEDYRALAERDAERK
ncbi:MAG: molybdenum cofactor cytidylyltransferase [Chloroflexi bacterium]|nr:molybdenum cofactor cytidylyltransferase [Chloroflexota bacterium]